MKRLILVSLIFAASASAFAKSTDLTQDMDSLGGNQDIADRAKALDPKNQVQVVQKRTVDRNDRLELGLSAGVVAGGDPYVSTNNYGLNVDYHLNPRWSIGARYYHSVSDLTSEGQTMYSNANTSAHTGGDYTITQVDYPVDTGLAVINWYPIYGKLNLFDAGIAQFDLYTLAGYGKVQLQSGLTDTYTAGAGIGLWLTQHITTRFEVRWQTYQDQMYLGSQQLNLTIATLSIGYML
jgi:outer membrane beta-barrel protein